MEKVNLNFILKAYESVKANGLNSHEIILLDPIFSSLSDSISHEELDSKILDIKENLPTYTDVKNAELFVSVYFASRNFWDNHPGNFNKSATSAADAIGGVIGGVIGIPLSWGAIFTGAAGGYYLSELHGKFEEWVKEQEEKQKKKEK